MCVIRPPKEFHKIHKSAKNQSICKYTISDGSNKYARRFGSRSRCREQFAKGILIAFRQGVPAFPGVRNQTEHRLRVPPAFKHPHRLIEIPAERSDFALKPPP